MFAIKHNIPEIRDKLKRLQILLGEKPNWQDDFRNQVEKALYIIKHLTPLSVGSEGSQRGGSHLYEGWELHTIGGGGKDRVPLVCVIYNNFTHTKSGKIRESAKLKLVSGLKKNYTLLHVLEYGSRPHTIVPSPRFRKVSGSRSGFSMETKGRQYLRFEINGEVVFTKRVDHPGTRPYGMIRVTRAKLKMWMDKLRLRWQRRVMAEWARG